MSNAAIMTGGGNYSSEIFSNSLGVTLPGTSSIEGGPLVYTEWTEIIAATPCEAEQLTFVLNYLQTLSGGTMVGPHNNLFEIGIGAGGAEQVLIGDLLIGGATSLAYTFQFPQYVPRGARLSVRNAYYGTSTGGVTNAATMSVQAANGLTPRGSRRLKAYGSQVTSSSIAGTVLDPGGSTNNWGAWTQVAVLAEPSRGIMAQMGNAHESGFVNAGSAIQYGVWNGSSYVPWFAFASRRNSGGQLYNSQSGTMWRSLPRGTVIGARSMCASSNATGRLISTLFHSIT